MKSLHLNKLAVSTLAATALMAAGASTAQAASVASNFNVDITLTSACTISTPTNLAFAYTALQPTNATATSPFSITCPSSLPYTLALSGASVTDDAVGLAYTLSITSPGGAGTGTGSAQNFSVDGVIASGQSGTCLTATCTNAAATNKTHTLTVTY